MSPRALVLVAVLAAATGLGSPAASEEIRDFRVDVRLASDGSFEVEERILYDFGSQKRHGIYRDIPVQYGRGHAADYRIGLDVLSVTDESGRERPFKESRQGRNRRIRVGSAESTVTGAHEYRIHYRVRRGILWFEDHDEFYWNVTGNEWTVPIRSTDASVRLPDSAEHLDVSSLCFTGRQGSLETACTTERSGATVGVVTSRELGAREGLTLVIGLPKGVLREPTALAKLADRASDWWTSALLLPLATLLGVGGLWWTRGRDPGGPEAIPVRYEPPDGMTPAEMGTVLDERVDIDDITATILDLAVRGYLEIHELERKSFFFLSDSDYELRRIGRDEEGLKPHEVEILAAIFGDRSSRVLSDMKNQFYKRLPGIQEALYRQVSREAGWFPTRPDRVRSHWTIAAVALGMLAVFVFLVLERGPLALAAGASAAIVVAFGRHMPRKTRKGRRAAQHIHGFREFVERVEVDRLDRLGLRTAGQFEKILPYAFVLGASDAWAEAFADLYTAEPSWYHGQAGGTFRPRRFVNDVGRSLELCGKTMQSQPKSSGSGSSGFGGGGFSGGGFGGGGGGSW